MMYWIICMTISMLAGCWSIEGQKVPMANRNGQYTLHGKGFELVIDGHVGGRVISFKHGNTEVLGTDAIHPKYYGSTLWLGPQGKWKGNKVLDESPYTLVRRGNRKLVLKSQHDILNGVLIIKQFQIDDTDTSVVIKYRITNISKKPLEVSPWEVTRVPTGGLAFFPKGGENDVPSGHRGMPYLKIMERDGIIWYPYDSSKKSAEKLFMDGGEGWLAYKRNRVLFIKKFPKVEPNKIAPGEKNVEIYVNKDKSYLELENLGQYQRLKPGASLEYSVRWYVRKLEEDRTIGTENGALVDYVRAILGES